MREVELIWSLTHAEFVRPIMSLQKERSTHIDTYNVLVAEYLGKSVHPTTGNRGNVFKWTYTLKYNTETI